VDFGLGVLAHGISELDRLTDCLRAHGQKPEKSQGSHVDKGTRYLERSHGLCDKRLDSRST
jgi:hypothetical protein